MKRATADVNHGRDFFRLIVREIASGKADWEIWKNHNFLVGTDSRTEVGFGGINFDQSKSDAEHFLRTHVNPHAEVNWTELDEK